MSSATAGTADRMLRLGASLGPVWRRHRRALPPDIRESFTDLMAKVGAYVIPGGGSMTSEHLGDTRANIEVINEMLRLLSVMDPGGQLEVVGSPCASRRWSELVEEEAAEGFGDSSAGISQTNLDLACTFTQTDLDLSNTTVVLGGEAMIGVVFESACSNILGELRSARSVLEAEYGGFCGEADDLVDPIGGCSHLALADYSDQGAKEMDELSAAQELILGVLGRMDIATNAVYEEACSAI